jgi:hypothetical protein
MGMEQTVTFAGESVPAWTAVRDLLARLGYPVEMRMINGELSFPDEVPPDHWQELRIGTPAGMVTLRRQQELVRFVIWGNADAAMREAWNALTWAFASTGGGRILGSQGEVSAAMFQEAAELPAILREMADQLRDNSSS